MKGNDNSVVNALSSISLTSESFKQMNEYIMLVMTRGQKMCLQLGENLNLPNFSKLTEARPDQPQVVKILKIRNESTKMTFIVND